MVSVFLQKKKIPFQKSIRIESVINLCLVKIKILPRNLSYIVSLYQMRCFINGEILILDNQTMKTDILGSVIPTDNTEKIKYRVRHTLRYLIKENDTKTLIE